MQLSPDENQRFRILAEKASGNPHSLTVSEITELRILTEKLNQQRETLTKEQQESLDLAIMILTNTAILALAGGGVGAFVGAIAGSMVAPGVGTIVGATGGLLYSWLKREFLD